MRDRFLVIEGNEGVGKTTLVSLAANYLREQGVPVHLFHQPGTTPVGLAVRKVLTDMHYTLAADVKARLVEAARLDGCLHFRGILDKYPNAWVIGDRHSLSTVVYQQMLEGADATSIEVMEEVNSKVLNPWRVVLLDAPAEVSYARVHARGEARKEMFDSASLSTLHKIRCNYLARGPKELFDATGTPEGALSQLKPWLDEMVEISRQAS